MDDKTEGFSWSKQDMIQKPAFLQNSSWITADEVKK
jgi:hypothetical protein